MSRNNNKKKLRYTPYKDDKVNSLCLRVPILYNNPAGKDVLYDLPIDLPQGLSKKKAVKAVQYLFNFYCPTVTFEDLCTQQGWKFLIQWKRGNYQYL